jgi:2-oxoglutarate dehydrogenase E2 component (dihydrolipoamide succinyltransferase)
MFIKEKKMAIEIKSPAFPESVADGTVSAWHKAPGDAVSRDDLLAEIETDKVVMEVVATENGVMGEILKAEGETVLSQEVIGYLEAGGAAAEGTFTAGAAAEPAGGTEQDIKAPAFPESVADGTVSAWHKAVGDTVNRDELLVEIETDKVVLEVVAPDDGVLSAIVKAEGDTVLSEEIIGRFSAGAKTAATAPPTAASETTAATTAPVLSPAARQLAEENNIDPAQINGTGKDGRVTKEDVLNHLKNPPAQPAVQTAAVTAQAVEPAVAPQAFDTTGRVEKRVPMTRLRARVAERLLDASRNTAMLTTFNEVNMAPVMQLRSKYKETFEKAHNGTKLGFMSFFVKASVEALKRFPVVNASIDGNDVVYHGYQDIGIAVSSDRGLVVPVLRDAEYLGLADIESAIRDFGSKAREGKLGIDELTGGTFTITNGGVFGSLMSTPILNPPQTAILGMHKIQDRPMAVDGEVKILPMMYLALSYDHRLIDGKDAVQFLVAIKDMLEDPARILLEI